MNRQSLEETVYAAYPHFDMSEIERMPMKQLEDLVALTRTDFPAPIGRAVRRESKKPALPIMIKPKSIGEAFALINGRVMRRKVAIVEYMTRDNKRSTRQIEHLVPCGSRARFNGRIYSASAIADCLRTGHLEPIAKPKAPPRYKAQARSGKRVIHLGYFDSKEDRDAAVFAWKLGIRENT